MCGIAGIWHRNGNRASHRDLGRMMAAIAHRGPEGAAFARLDDGRMELGFLRLGFTDGGTCQQPIYDEAGRIALVYNGEIYDHPALRDGLERAGHRFTTRSDTEVIVHLWEEHGERCYEQLNGEFAFALWDGRKQELVLVRDRFGVKPLYYAWHRGAFVFASEIKALLALDGFSAELDPAYWAGPGVGALDVVVTPFRAIRQVRPGHALRIGRSSEREVSLWTPSFGPRAELTSLDEAADAVRAAVTRAVERRLEGDPPLAVSLSSGIDSTLVAGIAAASLRRRGKKLTAFTLGYDGASFDESAGAAASASHLGLSLVRVTETATSLADAFLEGIHSVEVPTNSLSTTARLALTRGVREAGFKALMSGEGSDELFGGYPYFGIEAIAREKGPSKHHALSRFRRAEASSRGIFWDDADLSRATTLTGHPSAYEARVRRTESAMRWLLAPGFRAQMPETPMAASRRELAHVRALEPSPFDATRLVSRGLLGSLVIPALGDRVEMAASLEGRVPYLDRDVIALAYALPERFCIDVASGVRKVVLRRAFEDLLPTRFAPPPKHTRMAPSFADLARTMRGRDLLETLLDPHAVRRVGVLDPSFVRWLRRAWRVVPERTHAFAGLDALIGYAASVQALHAVHVDDVLGHRARLAPMAQLEDRSLAPSATASFGGAS
jgi:asparagine synthase (glutamine-hydrolysing)